MSDSAPSAPRKAGTAPAAKRGLFARLSLFLRQIVAELRKVVRPSRTELWTFFVVVIVFVLAIMAFVGVLDFLFGQAVLFIFGS
ncbi:MAG: preprotein translocase subunit SecE [Actinobacteria bacterium]|jgi:preprotein translocase subunit SecE|nr:preprotein translocase subunit SecE [Actinomycetota bacterium]